MIIVVMILEVVEIVKVLVASLTISVNGTLHVVLRQSPLGVKVFVARVADPVARGVALMLV